MCYFNHSSPLMVCIQSVSVKFCVIIPNAAPPEVRRGARPLTLCTPIDASGLSCLTG